MKVVIAAFLLVGIYVLVIVCGSNKKPTPPRYEDDIETDDPDY